MTPAVGPCIDHSKTDLLRQKTWLATNNQNWNHIKTLWRTCFKSELVFVMISQGTITLAWRHISFNIFRRDMLYVNVWWCKTLTIFKTAIYWTHVTLSIKIHYQIMTSKSDLGATQIYQHFPLQTNIFYLTSCPPPMLWPRSHLFHMTLW